jgi:copper chaperone CopZ
MKKLVPSWRFVAAAAVAVLFAAPFVIRAAEQEPTTPLVTSIFKVEGMTCGGCEASVKMTVKRLDGVQAVEASHTEKRATVTYDPEKVTPQAIVDTIEKLGYTAELVETKTATAEPKATGLLAKLRACC